MNRILLLFLCLTITILSPVANAAPPKKEPQDNLSKRLARLEKRIEAARVKNHIPGLALAVVKGDRVIFAKGFGHRDLEAKKPVSEDTLFAIGSSTKSFTATLMMMLVDDGKLRLDDPVSRFIPGLAMRVDGGDKKITMRDLLCHRTGFSRMGVLWAGGKTTRPEVIEMAQTAEPLAKLRKKFLYNNVTYMMAGYGAGKSVKSDWETLVKTRIFKPLGMRDSSTSISIARKDPRLSKGYRWVSERKEHMHLPMRNLDTIGPAGSINSNVVDMAKWVRFQLGQGKFAGKRLLSKKQHSQLWTKQIDIAPGVGYGLGWMIREWNGKKLVEHGGNIDGFGAAMALLPEEGLGFVLLTNVTATPLQTSSMEIVFDSLLGRPAVKSAKRDKIDTTALEGVYIANFTQFRGEKFTVLKKDGKLAIDIPSQRTFELKQPDEKGKWYFALTDRIAVSFSMVKDKAISVTLHQGGADFECFRRGVEVPIEVPLDKLQPLIGTFRDERQKQNIKVMIADNRLMVVAPKIGTFGLFPPDDKGKWAFRFKRDAGQLRFNKGGDGAVVSVTRFSGGKEHVMPRITDASAALPTAKTVMAKIKASLGGKNVKALGDVRLTGTISFVHQGAKGKITQLIAGLDRHRTSIDLGKLGFIDSAYDGKRGWSDSTFSTFEEVLGPRLRVQRNSHPMWLLGNWPMDYKTVTIVNIGTVDGEKIIEMKLAGKGIPKRLLFVNAKTGFVTKQVSAEIIPGIGRMPVTVKYSDYRPVNGVMMPFKSVTETAQSGHTVIQLKKATSVKKLPKDTFRLKRKDK